VLRPLLTVAVLLVALSVVPLPWIASRPGLLAVDVMALASSSLLLQLTIAGLRHQSQ
jgi:hypothetical protein